MNTIILLIIVTAPDGYYSHQELFDNMIECQLARDEFDHRARLTGTAGDTEFNECIDYEQTAGNRHSDQIHE